jgi:opacity protein-like surface antigen
MEEAVMRRMIIASAAALTLASAGAAHAQFPVEIELRGGAAFPTEDLGDAKLKTGGGGGLTVNVRFMPHLAAYAGWDYMQLQPKRAFGNFDVENTGYAFGLQFQHPVFRSIGTWVRAGGMYAHIEIEDENGDLAADTDHELGWEAGGGVSVPIGQRFTLTPGVRYRTLSADLVADDITTPVDLSYIAAEIGLQFRLGARASTTALRR